MRIDSPNRESISISLFMLQKIDGLQRSPDLPFLITTVCFRCELDDSVKRNLYVGQIGLRKIVEVGIAITTKGLHGIRPQSKKLAARTDIGEWPVTEQNKLKGKVNQASITHLMSHNEHILLSFELHYHRLQSSDNVTVRFPPYIIILPVKLRASIIESGATNRDTDN